MPLWSLIVAAAVAAPGETRPVSGETGSPRALLLQSAGRPVRASLERTAREPSRTVAGESSRAALAGSAAQEESVSKGRWVANASVGATVTSGPVPGDDPAAWNPRTTLGAWGTLGRAWASGLRATASWGASRTWVLCDTCDDHLAPGTLAGAGPWLEPAPLTLAGEQALGEGRRVALGARWAVPTSPRELACNPHVGSLGPTVRSFVPVGEGAVTARASFLASTHFAAAAPVGRDACSLPLRTPTVQTLGGAVAPQTPDAWYGGAPNPAWTSSASVGVFDPHRWAFPAADKWGSGLAVGVDLRRARSSGAASVPTLGGPIHLDRADTTVDPWLPVGLVARRQLTDGLAVAASGRAAFPLRVADPAASTRAGLARTALTLALEARPREERRR